MNGRSRAPTRTMEGGTQMLVAFGLALAALALIVARVRHVEQAREKGQRPDNKYTGWDMACAAVAMVGIMLLPAVHDPAASGADWLSGQAASLLGASSAPKAPGR